MNVEQLICDSYNHDEKICYINNENRPKLLFQLCQKHSISQNEIGPLLGPSKALNSDKYEMCFSLLNQFNINSVFSPAKS